MAITEDTPQASKGFREWQIVLFRKAPTQLRRITQAGNQIRALTATTPRKSR